MGIVGAVSGKIFSVGEVGSAGVLKMIKRIVIVALLIGAAVVVYHLIDMKDKAYVVKKTKAELPETASGKVDAKIFELFKGIQGYSSTTKWGEIEKLISPQTAQLTDSAGWTPLHWAAFYNQRRIAEMLINAGAARDAKTMSGRTVLEIAKVKSEESGSVYELLRGE